MINARSIATLGIGFGALAIATIGFNTQIVQAAPIPMGMRIPFRIPVAITDDQHETVLRRQEEELIVLLL